MCMSDLEHFFSQGLLKELEIMLALRPYSYLHYTNSLEAKKSVSEVTNSLLEQAFSTDYVLGLFLACNLTTHSSKNLAFKTSFRHLAWEIKQRKESSPDGTYKFNLFEAVCLM